MDVDSTNVKMVQHSKCYCSVPNCSNSKRKQPYLSFHDFPADYVLRKQWAKAIRREEGPFFTILRGSTFVCSRHFRPGEIYVKEGGSRPRLKRGSIPSRFVWNDWGTREVPVPPPPERPAGLRVRDMRALMDHDYCPPPHGAVDAAADRREVLEWKVMEVEDEAVPVPVQTQQPALNRFCSTDEEFFFFTHFTSERVFLWFWESVEPSASTFVCWSEAQREALGTPGPERELALVDECFLFLCRIAAGLEEQALASMFSISLSAVKSTILTWTRYLYLLLGSLPTWMTREQVQATTPDKILRCYPEVRVIVGSTQICCEAASSLPPQSETTFKGLIGIAPCGAMTFVSKLYAGSISEQELTRKSNLLSLLEPGDGVMAGWGFQIETMLAEVGATLVPPPQLCRDDAERTEAVARLGLLVETAIHRVKEYHIWDGVLPISLRGSINQLWLICCLLSNYQGPFDIKEDQPV